MAEMNNCREQDYQDVSGKLDSCINIVFSSDEEYAVPTYIAIYSLVKNYKGTRNLRIYILYKQRFPETCKTLLEDFVNEVKTTNISFKYIDMEENYSDLEFRKKHIKTPTMYRLSIPNQIVEAERCVYLDSDIVVEGDISELYDLDLIGMPIAGVKDAILADKENVELCSLLGIPAMDQYINAGVLLMDLKAIRELHLDDVLVNKGKACKEYPYNDQDILNSVFYNRTSLLPLRYNVAIAYISRSQKMGEKSKEIRRSSIIHFINEGKPWSYPVSIGASYWWKYVWMQNKAIRKTFIKPYIKRHRGTLVRMIKEGGKNILVKTGLLVPVSKIYYRLVGWNQNN